jgi:hypothetical protein
MSTTQHVDFILIGDPVIARNTVQNALESRGFHLNWSDPWTGVAERGSKAANVLAGALAQYMRVDFQVRDAGDGQTTFRISKASTGAMGGLVGVARTRKNLAALRAELEGTFTRAGVLRGLEVHQR